MNWGKSILIFFIVFVSVSIYFIIFSLRQNNDLVTKDYYEQGANYSQQIDVETRSEPYHNKLNIINSPYNVIVVADTSVIKSKSIHIHFYRASDKKLDIVIQEQLNRDSILIDNSQFARGNYKAIFSWEMNNAKYEVTKQFFFKQTNSIK